MTPGFRWFGIFVTAAVLSLAFYNGAHATERPERNPICVAAMTPDLGVVYDRLESGMPATIVRYFVLTDASNTPAGSWLLLTFIDAWVFADALGQHHSRSEAIDIGLDLCRVEPGHVSNPYNGDGGAVSPLKNERI